MELLNLGCVNNILAECQIVEGEENNTFIKRYPIFHNKLMQKCRQDKPYSERLYNCLAYLQSNFIKMALDQIENCILLDQQQKETDFVVMKGLIYWSLMENEKGYGQFWKAYGMEQNNYEVVLFLEMITPKVESLYKDAKYLLIEKKVEKCKLTVKMALQMQPNHTQLLILNAYLHRINEEYEDALTSLERANKTLEGKGMENELRQQISLTYNEMGIYLFKQEKY